MSAQATAVAPLPPPTIEDLEEIYSFRDPDAVRAFLAANPDLLGVLREISTRGAAYLPTIERPILEVVDDPEDEEGHLQVFVLIPTRLDPADARTQIRRMSRDWLLDTFRQTGGRVNVDVEYL